MLEYFSFFTIPGEIYLHNGPFISPTEDGRLKAREAVRDELARWGGYWIIVTDEDGKRKKQLRPVADVEAVVDTVVFTLADKEGGVICQMNLSAFSEA